jgi:NAD(P)-dependent dehydrogenase (short-subunit alcohol dehydrogenase family)
VTGPLQVFLVGEDPPVEEGLAGRGLELVRDAPDAEALVTLAPPVELRPIAELGPEEWMRIFRGFAEEPFFSAQPWLREAYARGSGTWVAVTSVLATQAFPGGAAGAAACALQTLVRIAALEGVRANAVAAGWREDRLPETLDRDLAVADTPRRRLASAEDVAAAVTWLLSDDSSHVNGEVLRVDGGYTITRGTRPDPGRE